ncbi:MAG: helix-turn-helix domain-containing protein [Stackebrandtia sp.]
MSVVHQWTGATARALRLAARMSVRAFAAHLGVNERTVSKWDSGGVDLVPTPATQEILDTALAMFPADVRQRFDALVDARETPKRVVPSSADASILSTQLVRADVRAISQFARNFTTGMANTATMDFIEGEIHRLAVDYLALSTVDIFADLQGLRRTVFDLLDHNRYPAQQRRLLLYGARLCGLYSHVLMDTGFYRPAATVAATAWECATAADHPNTRAWVRGIQSLIAYWDNDHRAAADLAAAGTRLASSGSATVRLPGLHARAAAALGNTRTATLALSTAATARDLYRPDPDDVGGLFDFPEAKQATYAGTTLLALASPSHINKAIDESTRAITLYNASGNHDVSQPDMLAARLDLATAHLAAGDLDGTDEQTRFVLAAPPDAHTASITKRLATLTDTLATTAAGASAAGKQLHEDLECFNQHHKRQVGDQQP